MKVLICVGLLALGCSKGSEAPEPNDPDDVTDDRRTPAPAAAPKCVDGDDEPIQCETDDECCDGFVCGIDPQQSHRLKYCVFAG